MEMEKLKGSERSAGARFTAHSITGGNRQIWRRIGWGWGGRVGGEELGVQLQTLSAMYFWPEQQQRCSAVQAGGSRTVL